MRIWSFAIVTAIFLAGCHNGGSAVTSSGSCAKVPTMPITAAHYESRELFAKTVIRETARAMLDGQCSDAAGLAKLADENVEVQCSDSGCDIGPRAGQKNN